VGIAAELAAGRLVLDGKADRARTVAALLALPGIGPWTAGYIAMRALRDPDAFTPGDAGLRHGLKLLGCEAGRRDVERVSEGWRPFRAYAIQHLWALAAASPRSSRAAA
jgi:AraC family transcriptional regulator of adaptative response / DNA-3-methyladenine glycosylase II